MHPLGLMRSTWIGGEGENEGRLAGRVHAVRTGAMAWGGGDRKGLKAEAGAERGRAVT